MKYGLKEQTIALINSVFANYPEIEQAILYGSRAKGTYKKGSDIDLALKGSNLNRSVMHKICDDLDDLFLPYSFDISIFTQINNTDLIDHINRVGIVFYRSEADNGSRSLTTNEA